MMEKIIELYLIFNAILVRKLDLGTFLISETGEKMRKSTFQVTFLVQTIFFLHGYSRAILQEI